jgi:GNAT superfamily N-acetyltransferase
MQILDVSDANLRECTAFLKENEETAQFLINNLREFGPSLTDHHNSGNFRLVMIGDEIKGVFCLTRRGNLLVQSEVNCPEAVLKSLRADPISLKGFVGDWQSIEPVLNLYRQMHPDYQPTYESKEILYSFALPASGAALVHDARVRFLGERDFPQWLAYTKAYLAELSIPDELSDEQKRSDFESRVQNRVWWGLFEGGTLLSMAALNSHSESVGQVGGVYTSPVHRQKGLGKAVMAHMLKDCRDVHHHAKSIFFTGETDIPAQKLYESLGYKRIGSFALVLS